MLAGLLVFTLPETLGAAMPDNMKDMEQIQSIFSTGECALPGTLLSRFGAAGHCGTAGNTPRVRRDGDDAPLCACAGVWKHGWRATRKQLFSTRAHGASHTEQKPPQGAQRLPTVDEEQAQRSASSIVAKDAGKGGAGGPLASATELPALGAHGGIPAAAAAGAGGAPHTEGQHHEGEHVSLLQPHHHTHAGRT